jgi:hypothetical protein
VLRKDEECQTNPHHRGQRGTNRHRQHHVSPVRETITVAYHLPATQIAGAETSADAPTTIDLAMTEMIDLEVHGSNGETEIEKVATKTGAIGTGAQTDETGTGMKTGEEEATPETGTETETMTLRSALIRKDKGKERKEGIDLGRRKVSAGLGTKKSAVTTRTKTAVKGALTEVTATDHLPPVVGETETETGTGTAVKLIPRKQGARNLPKKRMHRSRLLVQPLLAAAVAVKR